MGNIFLFAGGPSLADIDPIPFIHKGISIGVNDSALKIPVDFFFTMDRLWFENRAEQLRGRPGIIRHSVYDSSLSKGLIWPEVKRVEMLYNKTNLNLYGETVHGNNSGFCAYNYAVLQGLHNWVDTKIFLFGFDMQGRQGKSHWYQLYEWVGKKKTGNEYRKWAKDFDNSKVDILKTGIKVYNVSNNSLITAFPVIQPSEVLPLCMS